MRGAGFRGGAHALPPVGFSTQPAVARARTRLNSEGAPPMASANSGPPHVIGKLSITRAFSLGDVQSVESCVYEGVHALARLRVLKLIGNGWYS